MYATYVVISSIFFWWKFHYNIPIVGAPGGKYMGKGGDYEEGQVIPHDALIHFTCPGQDPYPDRPPLQCKLGHLIPTTPHCGVLGHEDWLTKLGGSQVKYGLWLLRLYFLPS